MGRLRFGGLEKGQWPYTGKAWQVGVFILRIIIMFDDNEVLHEVFVTGKLASYTYSEYLNLGDE